MKEECDKQGELLDEQVKPIQENGEKNRMNDDMKYTK